MNTEGDFSADDVNRLLAVGLNSLFVLQLLIFRFIAKISLASYIMVGLYCLHFIKVYVVVYKHGFYGNSILGRSIVQLAGWYSHTVLGCRLIQ